MRQVMTISAVFAVLLAAGSAVALAEYSVAYRGLWPQSWPAELEPLRDQAKTFEGPIRPQLHYAIPFDSQEKFEAAWPHMLKVTTPGAPIVLRRAPSFWLGGKATVGVCIHTPPVNVEPTAEGRSRADAIYIEVIVDGDIVDLNRIPLPPDTPIIDERFKESEAN